MDLEEFKIRNDVFEYGVTESEIKQLEAEYKRNLNSGTIFIFRKDKYVYGVDYSKNYYNSNGKNKIVREENKKIKTFPSMTFKGLDIGFELSDNDIKQISNIKNNFTDYRDFDIPNKMKKAIYTNMKDLKMFLSQIISSKSRYSNETRISKDALESVFWIFDTEYNNDILNIEVKDGFSKIIKVWEKDNIRYSLSVKGSRDRKDYTMYQFEHEDERYNYIDEGRVFTGRRYIWDDIDADELNINFIDKIASYNTFVLVTKEEYDKAVRKFQFKVKREKEEEELSKKIKSEIDSKLKNISEKNPIVLGGIKFTDEGIYYQNQQISGFMTKKEFDKRNWNYTNIETFADFVRQKIGEFEGKTPDFNRLYESFCTELELREFEGVLGSINVKVEKKETNAGGFYYINDIRINKADVVPVLRRAICFNKDEEYKDLLERVSKCNLTFHDIISNGLIIKVKTGDSYNDSDEVMLKLQVKRKNNRNYIVVGDKDYRIPNTNKLVAISYTAIKGHTYGRRNTPNFAEMINLFKQMFKFNNQQITKVFNDGLKVYKEAIAKSEQFLKEAIKVCKASEISKDGKTGYLVTGNSGRKYMIAENLKIYEYPKMRYICIVDKTLGKGFHNDKLASRIYALKNDSFLVSEIYTLKS